MLPITKSFRDIHLIYWMTLEFFLFFENLGIKISKKFF